MNSTFAINQFKITDRLFVYSTRVITGSVKSFLVKKKSNTPGPSIVLPRMLLVPRLPHPPFHTCAPVRFFWHQRLSKSVLDEEPSPLMREVAEEQIEEMEEGQLILSHSSTLPAEGILRQDHKGMIYLDVSDEWIHRLFPLIGKKGGEKPPYFEYEGPFGAHIPVMTAKEWKNKQGLLKAPIPEIGEKYSFSITGCYRIRPEGWPEMDRVWFLTVDSPDLERLRERSLLPSKLASHPFQIVIGVKKKTSRISPPNGTYRINISCHAA